MMATIIEANEGDGAPVSVDKMADNCSGKSTKDACIRDLSAAVLTNVTSYLTSPSRLLFAAAMTPATTNQISPMTSTIMSSSPAWYSRIVTRRRRSYDDWCSKSDRGAWYEYEKYFNLVNIKSDCNADGKWTRLDCADFGKDVASKLNDDDMRLFWSVLIQEIICSHSGSLAAPT
jgi:hypothetical protein